MAPTIALFARPVARTAPPAAQPAPRTTRASRAILAVTLLIGVCASMLTAAAPAQAADPIRGQTALEASICWVIDALINTERHLHGLPAVHMNTDLRVSAHQHNLTMARYDEMSHQLPGEAYFATRIQRAGYDWTWAGENIGWNSLMSLAGVVYLEKVMYREKPPNDGHRLNILSPHFRDVGVDVYFDKKHHKVWLTTDFGRR